jgi:hypothetical protein
MPITDIVFGGQISKAFDLFGPAFKKKLRDEGLTANVVPGANIEFSSLIGAAKAVIHSQA